MLRRAGSTCRVRRLLVVVSVCRGVYRCGGALGPHDSAEDVVLRDAHPHPSDRPACLLTGRDLKRGDLVEHGRGQESTGMITPVDNIPSPSPTQLHTPSTTHQSVVPPPPSPTHQSVIPPSSC